MNELQMRQAAMLEDLAYRGADLPIPCSSPDLILFLSFKVLYAYATWGKLSPAEGRLIKQQILDNYEVGLANERIYEQVNEVRASLDPLEQELRSIEGVEKYPTICRFLKCIGGDAFGSQI